MSDHLRTSRECASIDIQVSAFNSLLIPNTGLEVRSPGAGLLEPVEAFIPLGPEAAASITERVRAAVSKSNAA